MSDLPFLTEEKDMPEAEQEQPQAEPEPQPEPKGETEPAAPPAAQPEEPKHIPLTALLDEREKRQKTERERDELARALQAIRAAQQPQQQPDLMADPQAALAHIEARAAQVAIAEKVKTSRFLAEKEYGAELVNQAYAFFDENPHLSHALLNHPSPYHEAVAIYKRHKALQEIGPDPDAYKAKLREQLMEELKANLTPPAPKAPPPSMAASPGVSGGKEPPASGFSALFERE